MIEKSDIPHQMAVAFAHSYSKEMASHYNFPPSSKDLIWRKDGGKLIFDYFVKLFKLAQFTKGILFIDEVEKIVYHQNMLEKRNFVESLRYYVFDNSFANAKSNFYGLLLTIHPGVQELLLPHWKAAGLDRLAPIAQPEAKESTIYFDPLKEDMAIPLVTAYLDYFRINDSEKGNITPFTKDAIVEALVKKGGVPGPTLRLLHRIIEYAVNNQKNKITKEIVKIVNETEEHLEPVGVKEEIIPPRPKVDLTDGES